MKKTWKTTLFAVILAAALLFQTPGTAYAEGTPPAGNRCFASAETDAGAAGTGGSTDAASQGHSYTADEIREIEDGIIDWKKSLIGEKELFAGAFVDKAGDPASDWFAFSASRMGIEGDRASYLARMQETVEAIYADPEKYQGSLLVSDIYRMILTIKACGGNPEQFGTDPEGNPINLLKDHLWHTSVFGEPGKQGINGYIWALLTADAGNWNMPADAEWNQEAFITALLERQLADGGFGLILTDDSDVDLTSMTLTALAPYGDSDKTYTFTSAVTKEEVTTTVKEASEKAFACLAELESEDGTMLTYDTPTSESTSWAIMALCAWGRDPETDGQFMKNGKTLVDGQISFRLADGSIVHTDSGEYAETEGNNMASYQALYALEALYRLKTGGSRIFDMKNDVAYSVDQAQIDAAAEKLPEQTEPETEKSGEQAEADSGNRAVLLTVCIAAAVVILAVLFLFFLLKDKKKGTKKKGSGSAELENDDDEDDDW